MIAVPPAIGVPADDAAPELPLLLLLLLQPAATSASAATPASSIRRRNRDRDPPDSGETDLMT
jgi:hypothetical protein